MATRTPGLQNRSQYGSYWGQYASAAALPNASGNPLANPYFAQLEAGDIAFVTGGTLYVCSAAGTLAGGDAVWQAISTAPGLPAIPYIRGFVSGNAFRLAADPIPGLTTAGLCAVFYSETSQFGNRFLVGSNNDFDSGFFLRIGSESVTAVVTDGTGVIRTVSSFLPPLTNKWMVVWARFSGAGADSVATLFINGSQVADGFYPGVSGGIGGGGTFAVGARGTTADQPASADRIQGAGYVSRFPSNAEISEHFRDVVAAGRMVDLTGGSCNAAWRIDGADPGAVWTPFVGAGNLARVGATPLTWGEDSRVIYR